MAELVELREENALMRADLSANHHFNQVAMNEVLDNLHRGRAASSLPFFTPERNGSELLGFLDLGKGVVQLNLGFGDCVGVEAVQDLAAGHLC